MNNVDWNTVLATAGALFGSGGAITLLLRKGGYTVAKKKKLCPAPKGPPECPDPGCQSQVVQTAKDVKDLKNELSGTISPALAESGKAIARIDERTILMLEAMKK